MISNILGSLILLIKTKGDISGLKKTDKALLNVTKNANLLKKVTGGIFGAMNIHSIRDGFTKYLQLEKDIGAMKSRFFAVTKDEKLAVEEFEYIRKLATDTAMDIKSTADSYSIFASATFKNLGKEGARGVFEDWTRVGRVLHLSTYQFERVTYALREMASKGAIYSQDLRMQIGTHVPNAMGLAQKAAEEMGITGTDWFEKLQKKAKGNTEVTSKFVKLFSKYAREAYGSEEAFKKAMQQPDALASNIKNIGTNFMIDFSKAGGSYMMVKILKKVSDVLTSFDFEKMTSTLGAIARGIGKLVDLLPLLTEAIIYLAGSLIAFKIAQHTSRFVIWVSTLFKHLKSMTLARALGKMFSRNVFSRLIQRYGLKHILKEGFTKALTGVGVKALAKMGLSSLPFLGPIVMAIWTLIDIGRWIRKRFGKDNPKIGSIDVKTALQAIRDTQKDKKNAFSSPIALRESLAKHGGKDLMDYAYIDNGKITLNLNGTVFTEEDLEKLIKAGVETINDTRKNKPTRFDDKPDFKSRHDEHSTSVLGW